MQFDKTATLLYYTIVIALAAVLSISLIRIPSIIFVGIEDKALSVLIFATCLLFCLSAVLYIFDFFAIKLGFYGMLALRTAERNKAILDRLDKIERKQKEQAQKIQNLYWDRDNE